MCQTKERQDSRFCWGAEVIGDWNGLPQPMQGMSSQERSSTYPQPAASVARAASSIMLIAEQNFPVTPSNRQHLISTPKKLLAASETQQPPP